MARTIAQRRGLAAIGLRVSPARGNRKGFRPGPGRGAVEGFQQRQRPQPAGGVRRSPGGDEQRRRVAVDLRDISAAGGRRIRLAQKPSEPRQVRVPVEATQRRAGPILNGSARVISPVRLMALMLVLVLVVMVMPLRVVAKLARPMPVGVSASRVGVAQLEPGQAAEDDQADEHEMRGVVTRTSHDGIRRPTRCERGRTPALSYQTGCDASIPRGAVHRFVVAWPLALIVSGVRPAR